MTDTQDAAGESECVHKWRRLNTGRSPTLEKARKYVILPKDATLWCEVCGALRWFAATLEPSR